jgi:hypothetical protein
MRLNSDPGLLEESLRSIFMHFESSSGWMNVCRNLPMPSGTIPRNETGFNEPPECHTSLIITLLPFACMGCSVIGEFQKLFAKIS